MIGARTSSRRLADSLIKLSLSLLRVNGSPGVTSEAAMLNPPGIRNNHIPANSNHQDQNDSVASGG